MHVPISIHRVEGDLTEFSGVSLCSILLSGTLPCISAALTSPNLTTLCPQLKETAGHCLGPYLHPILNCSLETPYVVSWNNLRALFIHFSSLMDCYCTLPDIQCLNFLSMWSGFHIFNFFPSQKDKLYPCYLILPWSRSSANDISDIHLELNGSKSGVKS